MKNKFLLGCLFVLIITVTIFAFGCTKQEPVINIQDNDSQEHEPVVRIQDNNSQDLSSQCKRCPDLCRDQEDKIIDDINETGSCICVNESGECVRKIKPIIYYAPEIKPENFLGSHVSKEAFSDWMNYEPIIQKVEEITARISSDKEKSVAIANWVKNSKEYKEGDQIGPAEDASIANQGGTIIDIFEAEEGVCLDAGILAAAMMRLAGIPAMAVEPSYEGITAHALTYFYADEKWWQIEPVFSNDTNYTVSAKAYDDIAGSQYDIAYTMSYLCNNPYNEERSANRYTYYLDHPVTLNVYGHTCLPILFRYTQNWERGYMSPKGDGQYHWLFYTGLSLGDSHYNLKLWENYVIDEENTCEDVRTYYGDYLFCLDMPVGKYNITYSTFGREDLGQNNIVTVATLNFEIKDNTETKLSKDNFVKSADATDEEYELFIKYIEKILSYS